MTLDERDLYVAVFLAIALTVALATGLYWIAIGAFALPVLYVAIRFVDNWLDDHLEYWD
jgi:hypothetical protein